MIYVGTRLKIVDNSGVRIIDCIKILGSNPRVEGKVGNLIIGAVQRANPTKKIKVHDVCKCVIIKQCKPSIRSTGTHVSFYESAAVVVDQRKQPLGTRIRGSVMRELRKRRHLKIISLASSWI